MPLNSLGWISASAALLTASCNSAPPTYPKQLADGCYYAGGKPVFVISGDKGRLLVPGEASTFKVERGGDDYLAWAKFTPGILFDTVPPTRILVEAADTPSYVTRPSKGQVATAPLTF